MFVRTDGGANRVRNREVTITPITDREISPRRSIYISMRKAPGSSPLIFPLCLPRFCSMACDPHQSGPRAPIRKMPFDPTTMISSPMSTSFDFTESDTSGKPSSRCPSELSVISDTTPPKPSATRSRHYTAGILTVFKVRTTRSMKSSMLTG